MQELTLFNCHCNSFRRHRIRE